MKREDVCEVLKKEIKWRKRNKGKGFLKDQRWREGFIAGLTQAILLVENIRKP